VSFGRYPSLLWSSSLEGVMQVWLLW
jgi:hypothetical protein